MCRDGEVAVGTRLPNRDDSVPWQIEDITFVIPDQVKDAAKESVQPLLQELDAERSFLSKSLDNKGIAADVDLGHGTRETADQVLAWTLQTPQVQFRDQVRE